jgi:hypothetical protein
MNRKHLLIVAITVLISWLLVIGSFLLIAKADDIPLAPETYPVYPDEWSPTIHFKRGC